MCDVVTSDVAPSAAVTVMEVSVSRPDLVVAEGRDGAVAIGVGGDPVLDVRRSETGRWFVGVGDDILVVHAIGVGHRHALGQQIAVLVVVVRWWSPRWRRSAGP